MKLLALLATLAVSLLLLTSCGGGGGKKTVSTVDKGAIKVGLVTDIGQLNDRGFNHLAYVGLQRAERELGIHGRVAESVSAADYIPNLTTYARQGYNLVIGVGYTETDAVDAAARKFPNTD